MIFCITPNAAVDRTLVVPGHSAGGIFRPQETIVAAGGKGINVARAVKILGGEPLCGGFLAGHSGHFIADYVQNEGLASHWTWLDGHESRTCTIIVDPDTGHNTVINERGATLSEADWRQLQTDVITAAQALTTIAFCGSVPPGSSMPIFAGLLGELCKAGKPVWVDSSNVSLETAATVRGVALKVNDEEAAILLDAPIVGVDAAIEAAQQLHARSAAPIVLTLGAKGAVFVDDSGTWYAQPPTIEAKSAVGSGDSFLAGLLVALERGLPAPEALKQAAAAGAANALLMGGARFKLEDVRQLMAQTRVSNR